MYIYIYTIIILTCFIDMYVYIYIYIYICTHLLYLCIYIYIYIYICMPVRRGSDAGNGSLRALPPSLGSASRFSDFYIFVLANCAHGGEYPHEADDRTDAISWYDIL